MKASVDTTFDHKDPYQVLGIMVDASPAEIRKAYLGLAKRNHPNLFATDPEKYRASNALMQYINAAYDLLSDAVQKEVWDRKHLGAPPRAVSRPEREPQEYYDHDLVDAVIRRYNAFLITLRTEAERQEAHRRIERFRASREGSAFIRDLVARHYRRVLDLIERGRQITMYDDGLVEIMFLYAGKLEVTPSDIFVTYAFLQYQHEHEKARAGQGSGQRVAEDGRAGTRKGRAG